jgi:hypothetical protein
VRPPIRSIGVILIVMPARNFHNVAPISICLLFLVGVAFAVIVHDTVRYDKPVRVIRGRMTSNGAVVIYGWVNVYDNAQVCLDDSISPAEQRKRQTRVVSVKPNEKGEFNIRRLPKGFYEVEFGNQGQGGYNSLSVLVNVDPKGNTDGICVNLGVEGGGQSSVAKCEAE